MANLTILIAMLSGTDNVAGSANGLRGSNADRDTEEAAVIIGVVLGSTQLRSNW